MNVKAVIEELPSYKLDEWDIKEVFIKCVRNDIYESKHIYLDVKEIVMGETIRESILLTQDSLIKKYDSMANAKLVKEFHSFRYMVKPDKHEGNETQFYVYDHMIRELIYLLRYAINGTFDKDYSDVQKWMDERQIKYDTDSGNWKIRRLDSEDIIIRLYKNHKCIVKGLTDDEYKRISDGFETYKKYGGR